MVIDVTEQDFEKEVVERSREVPVVVDFWAEWCGPCRTLTPALEQAANAREGKVVLAKLDTDANPTLSQAFGIQGIPAVKAFRNGQVVDEFVGAQPPAAVERFFDGLVPSEAEELVEQGGEENLRRAVALEPANARAAVDLSRLLHEHGKDDEALEVLENFPADFGAEALAARIRLERAGEPDFAEAFAALDAGDRRRALELLEASIQKHPDEREDVRRVMVGVFDELGPEDEVAREFRRRLAAALY